MPVKLQIGPCIKLLKPALLLICGILSSGAYAAGESAASRAWQRSQMPFRNSHITLIYPVNLAPELTRLQWLVTTADRSTVTLDPIETDASGLVKENDVFVVTHDLLLWFNCNSPESVPTNGGGGLLRGLWTLHLDGSNRLNFQRIINDKNYAPSYFYAGSAPGVEGSGISLLGNFGQRNIDHGITFAIEHEHSPAITGVTGETIAEGEHAGGVFVQFTGIIGNSSLTRDELSELGLQDHYDCDARPGITGRCEYTLTYRIPASGDSLRQEIALKVTQNNFGPCATMVLSHNIAGYPNQPVTFVSAPQLVCKDLTPDLNTYFRIDGQELNFYTLPWTSRPGTNRWWEPLLERGTVAGVGVPEDAHSVPFFVYCPLISALPPALQTTYALQAIDNQGANSSHRCLALDLQLWDVNRHTPPHTFPEGTTLNIITDYMIRDPGAGQASQVEWSGQ